MNRLKIAKQIIKIAKQLLVSGISREQRMLCWRRINEIRNHFNLPQLRQEEEILYKTQQPDSHHLWGIINSSLKQSIIQDSLRRRKLKQICDENKLENIKTIDDLQNSDLDKIELAVVYQILRTKRLRKQEHRKLHREQQNQPIVSWSESLQRFEEINKFPDFLKYLQQLFFSYRISSTQIKQMQNLILERLKKWTKKYKPQPRNRK